MRHALIELSHLSHLLRMPNDCRMVDVEFFGNFLCACKRTSFDNGSPLVIVNFQWPATTLIIFKALVSFGKLLEPPLRSAFLSSSWDDRVSHELKKDDLISVCGDRVVGV